MKQAQIVTEIVSRNPTEGPENSLPLAVAAVDGLDVYRPADPHARREIHGLMS